MSLPHREDPFVRGESRAADLHCFGCGEGGDAIAFLVKNERLSFLERCGSWQRGRV